MKSRLLPRHQMAFVRPAAVRKSTAVRFNKSVSDGKVKN